MLIKHENKDFNGFQYVNGSKIRFRKGVAEVPDMDLPKPAPEANKPEKVEEPKKESKEEPKKKPKKSKKK